MIKQNERGQEIFDEPPLTLPFQLDAPMSLEERIARMMKQQHLMAQHLSPDYKETPEEADDFDIEDDPIDPLTPWEQHFMPSADAFDEPPADAANAAPAAEPAPVPEPEPVKLKRSGRKKTTSADEDEES